MRDSLVLARRPPRRGWRRWRRWAVPALLVWLCLPALAFGADRLLAAHYAGRLDGLTAENAALRRDLAACAHLAEENEALRSLLGSARAAGSWQPAWAAARWPGGFALAGEAEPGAAVLDRYGRYAGEVTGTALGLLAVERGTPAGLVGGTVGLLRDGVLTGLPLHSGLAAGDVVTTPAGHWLGRLREAPASDADGLTAHAALEDTADMADLLYFVQR